MTGVNVHDDVVASVLKFRQEQQLEKHGQNQQLQENNMKTPDVKTIATKDKLLDSNYEYDAPMFVDFTTMDNDNDDEEASKWFDERKSTPTLVKDGAERSVLRSTTNQSNTLSPSVEPVKHSYEITGATTRIDSENDATKIHVEPSGMISNLVSNVKSFKSTGSSAAKPPMKTSVSKQSSATKSTKSSSSSRPTTRASSNTSSSLSSNKKMSSSSSSLSSVTSVTKSTISSSQKTRPVPSSPTTTSKRNSTSLTKPITPPFMKRERRPRQRVLSSVELELEEIKAQKHEMKKQRRSNSTFYDKTRSSPCKSASSSKARVQSSTTVPKPFSLHTDNMKVRSAKTNTSATGKKRKPIKANYSPLKSTQPQPFKFHETRHRATGSTSGSSEPYVPIAQAVAQYESGWSSSARESSSSARESSSSKTTSDVVSSLTAPQGPNLTTMARHRPTLVKSEEERESELMSNIPQFKARPVNQRVLESMGDHGIPRVPKPAPTRPIEPHFHCEDRAIMRNRSSTFREQERLSDSTTFRARPVPEHVLRGESHKDRPSTNSALTVPESPCLSTKVRARNRPVVTTCSENTEATIIKAKAAPHFSSPHLPEREPSRTTVPKPFNVSSYPNPYEVRERLQEENEAKMKALRNIKAAPMPCLDEQDPLPMVRSRPVTKPQPFHLQTDIRGKESRIAWENKIEAELEAEEAQFSSFHARDPAVIYEQPFIPKSSSTSVTEPIPFDLHVESRLEERSQYDFEREERDRIAKITAAEKAKEDAAIDAEDLKRLRESLVHHAAPIRHYNDVKPVSHPLPLTEPQSPFIGEKRRKVMSCLPR